MKRRYEEMDDALKEGRRSLGIDVLIGRDLW